MRMLSDELRDIDGLADLDELLNLLILGSDDWEEMAAIAKANGSVHQCAAVRALLHWCHAVAWLLGVVEDVAPIARR